jgi:hypothetical protein
MNKDEIIQIFKEDVFSISEIDDSAFRIGQIFTDLITGDMPKVKIICSENIFDYRIQSTSRNGDITIFVPAMFMGNKPKRTEIWNLMAETVSEISKLGGPSLVEYNNNYLL